MYFYDMNFFDIFFVMFGVIGGSSSLPFKDHSYNYISNCYKIYRLN